MSDRKFLGVFINPVYRQARDRLVAIGMEKIKLSARGWPPPWNRSSGMDYRTLAEVVLSLVGMIRDSREDGMWCRGMDTCLTANST